MLTDITLGQYFPGTSFLHKLDPRIKIVATMIFIVAIFFAHSLASYAIVTAFVALNFAISRLPAKFIVKSLKPLWVIIIFTMGVHIFTTPGDVLWQYGIFHITKEGLYQGALMTARLVFLIVFSSLLTYTTSPIVLTDGIEHLLNPFKRIGVPAHELAMMMTIALRFIPTLIEETDKIMNAQKARGAQLDTGKMTDRVKALVPVLIPLFISAFRRADELAMAMECRCYRGGDGRTRLKVLRCEKQDYIDLAVCIACFAVILASRLVFPNF